jgi:tripartite-type tricarboxylate transporter receptor subunit TctC
VLTEVLAGRLDLGAIVLGSASGRDDIRLLAVFDVARNPAFPEVATAIEQGFEVAPTSFGGLMAPAGTPDERIAVLEAACLAVASEEGYRAAARRGLQPLEFSAGTTEFSRRLEADIASKAVLLRTIRLDP